MCMKIFKKLASKTDLDMQELQLYYRIRYHFVHPLDISSDARHEVSLFVIVMRVESIFALVSASVGC